MGYTFQEIPIFIFIGVLGKKPKRMGLAASTTWALGTGGPLGEEAPLAMGLRLPVQPVESSANTWTVSAALFPPVSPLLLLISKPSSLSLCC